MPTTPFDIPQILQRQTEMNNIINSTTANLTEQHNAIADDLSTKKRQIAFAYSQQRRNYAYNKILLLLISSLIISIVIYYVNENFKLLPSVMITLLISIIFSISIIWGYYIFLEIMSRSGDNYDELNLGTLDTFGTILEGADTIDENSSNQTQSNTMASILKNHEVDNENTRIVTSENARIAKNAAIKSGNYAVQSGDYANQSNESAIDANTSAEKSDASADAVSAIETENNKTMEENNQIFDTAMNRLDEAKETLQKVTGIAASVEDTTAAYTNIDNINAQLGFTTLKYAPYY